MGPVKDESVHLVLTSPPYFDLVEYAHGEAQLGQMHDSSDSISSEWSAGRPTAEDCVRRLHRESLARWSGREVTITSSRA